MKYKCTEKCEFICKYKKGAEVNKTVFVCQIRGFIVFLEQDKKDKKPLDNAKDI